MKEIPSQTRDQTRHEKIPGITNDQARLLGRDERGCRQREGQPDNAKIIRKLKYQVTKYKTEAQLQAKAIVKLHQQVTVLKEEHLVNLESRKKELYDAIDTIQALEIYVKRLPEFLP